MKNIKAKLKLVVLFAPKMICHVIYRAHQTVPCSIEVFKKLKEKSDKFDDQ